MSATDHLQDLTERIYNTLDEARKEVKAQMLDEGYVLRVRRTKRVGNRLDGDVKALIFVCSCQGNVVPASNAERKRIRGSRRTGCQFSSVVCRIQVEDEYKWFIELNDITHNHEPFVDIATYPKGRALIAAQQEEILSLCRFRLASNRIVSAMQREHNITVTPRNVYNIQDKERRRLLNGHSSISALLDGLEAGSLDASYHTQFDIERRLTHFLIVSPSAKEICCKYSAGGIWLIDATYKTNRFGLPLMYVVGVTAISQTFTFAYCFMAAECEANYLWALQLIQKCFVNFNMTPQTLVLTGS